MQRWYKLFVTLLGWKMFFLCRKKIERQEFVLTIGIWTRLVEKTTFHCQISTSYLLNVQNTRYNLLWTVMLGIIKSWMMKRTHRKLFSPLHGELITTGSCHLVLKMLGPLTLGLWPPCSMIWCIKKLKYMSTT